MHTKQVKKQISRRSFLQFTWKVALSLGGILGLGGLFRFLAAPEMDKPKDTYYLGQKAAYLAKPQTLIPEANAMILNSDGVLQAISTVCPHLGCLVTATDLGFSCPCHGSEFDSRGKRLSGRAETDLQTLKLVETADADLILYREVAQ
jgi:cytochrome b6-f complex iron-sulfur subunit